MQQPEISIHPLIGRLQKMRNRQNLLRNKSLTFWGHLILCQSGDAIFICIVKISQSERIHWPAEILAQKLFQGRIKSQRWRFRRNWWRNIRSYLTESSKSPASIAQSNKQWVGTCLYQEWYKPLLISCEAAIRLWASSEADCEYPLDIERDEREGCL